MGMSTRYKNSGSSTVTSRIYGSKKLHAVNDERLLDLIDGTVKALVREEVMLSKRNFDALTGADKYKGTITFKIDKLRKRLDEFQIERVRRGI